MIAQRAIIRSSQRFGLARAPIRRRPYSSEAPKFAGAEDNEFNRERARIEAHAPGSGGKGYAVTVRGGGLDRC